VSDNGDKYANMARGEGGRWLKGIPGGPGGNRRSEARKRHRELIANSTTDEDVQAVWARLIASAKAGEQWAVKEFFDRVLGKSTTPIELEEGVGQALVKVIKGVDPDRI